ncbi:DUF5304 domain-containing protein [Streptomyces cavernicola]|uniref:DUF5304 domain-containing protein n=1 Tax=Streptomyces cavernicola TaxID=3043613 RepID=A0ABT6S4R7_9ACTN|nr:DUF5304 domain-containing protein [Streptomyces sp. B-S-A6]MDI3403063.1 DUF5304 domain-containing protein [Streptomyces sp. B-S-A6]
MSDTERTASDADAWEKACAEDLAAEQARRRARYGEGTAEPGSAAEELRKLMDAVAEKLSSFQAPIAGAAAQGAVQHFVEQAKAAVEPVIERNPEVFDHLANAGSELLAAYRSAVSGHERRWTAGPDAACPQDRPGEKPEGTGPGEHIDLD